MFKEDVAAFRQGDWKLIESVGMRDAHWYSEPRNDRLNTTDPSAVTAWSESILRWLESWTTAGKFDSVRDLAVHIGIHALFRQDSDAMQVMLFNLSEDPSTCPLGNTGVAASTP